MLVEPPWRNVSGPIAWNTERGPATSTQELAATPRSHTSPAIRTPLETRNPEPPSDDSTVMQRTANRASSAAYHRCWPVLFADTLIAPGLAQSPTNEKSCGVNCPTRGPAR